ncbi:AEC family transporter [Thermoclostridium stercorarium]|uniref:AEC family transporter n=1 Tax=Thermoclostridium stercorarium TaxID=1510 RepID=UPI002248BF49|nr:AEC family transporter [Thermoclostridium stercorarium]UZQ86496.1 AEC family transporter [Thermoclostridium stercorarium]
MNFDIVFDQVLILLIIMVAGVIAGKAGIIADGASKKFSELLLYVTSPMLVLGSFFFEYSAEKFINGLMVFLIATVFYFFSIFLSSILFKGFDEKIKPIMRFSSVFSNAGFIGLPMMKALYGQDGVFLGSFYIVAFNLFVWTFGYTMYGEAKKGDGIKSLMKKALLNPSVIAVYVGIIIFVLRIPVPESVKSAVNYIGDMTMPLSMLIIGALISTAKIKELVNDARVYYVSAVRLILMPLLAYGILYLLGVPEQIVSIIVTALAMPVAATTTIFADLFDKDAVFASKAVMVSTILSVITAPVIVALL